MIEVRAVVPGEECTVESEHKGDSLNPAFVFLLFWRKVLRFVIHIQTFYPYTKHFHTISSFKPQKCLVCCTGEETADWTSCMS